MCGLQMHKDPLSAGGHLPWNQGIGEEMVGEQKGVNGTEKRWCRRNLLTAKECRMGEFNTRGLQAHISRTHTTHTAADIAGGRSRVKVEEV